MRLKFLLLFLLTIQYSQAQDSLFLDRTPEWALDAFEKSSLSENYYLIDSLNPFYLEEDFNGDEIIDIALMVTEKISNKRGVLIINGGKNICYIVGAGKNIGIGTDITWCKTWYVYRQKFAQNLNAKQKKILFKNPCIEIKKTAEKSIIIYWDKKRYSTYIKDLG